MAGSGGQQTSEMSPVWIIIGVFIIGFMIWYVARAQIVWFYFLIKRYEIDLMQFFIRGFESPTLEHAKQLILTTSPHSISFNDVSFVANEVGFYLRYPIAVLLIVGGVLLFARSTASRYRHVYNMQTLRDVNLDVWPQISPIASVDLVATDIDKGPWAMAMTPMRFAKHYKLLKETVASQKTQERVGAQTIAVSVMRERATRIFAMQLGKPWQGIDALNEHTKALFAAFAARAGRDSTASYRLLNQISESSRSGGLDFSGTDALLKKFSDLPAVVEITQKHAYVLTVMGALLAVARMDGVLSSADFLWLKPIDRRLWFMLNAVGRQTPSVEVAGPFAHWLAEKKLGHRVKTPMVEQATKALELAIKEIIYNPATDD